MGSTVEEMDHITRLDGACGFINTIYYERFQWYYIVIVINLAVFRFSLSQHIIRIIIYTDCWSYWLPYII